MKDKLRDTMHTIIKIRTTRKKAEAFLLWKLLMIGGIPFGIIYAAQETYCHYRPQAAPCAATKAQAAKAAATKDPPHVRHR